MPRTAPLRIRLGVNRSQFDLRRREVRIDFFQLLGRCAHIDQSGDVIERDACSPNDRCTTEKPRSSTTNSCGFLNWLKRRSTSSQMDDSKTWTVRDSSNLH